jgi:hypothetical protein
MGKYDNPLQGFRHTINTMTVPPFVLTIEGISHTYSKIPTSVTRTKNTPFPKLLSHCSVTSKWLTPWCGFFLEKLALSLIGNHRNFMEIGGSLPCSQQPTTCPNPEPDESNPLLHPISWIFILILPSLLLPGLPRALFLLRFPHNNSVWTYPAPPPYV